MNVDNINRLIAAVQAMETRITDYASWEQCASGIAWKLEGKPSHYASQFDLADWLGVDVRVTAKLEYLYEFSEDGVNRFRAFEGLSLDEQKAALVHALESLRDTGKVSWK